MFEEESESKLNSGGMILELLETDSIKLDLHLEPVNIALTMSWPENQGILFFYISKTLEMIRISFMASLLNAVL